MVPTGQGGAVPSFWEGVKRAGLWVIRGISRVVVDVGDIGEFQRRVASGMASGYAVAAVELAFLDFAARLLEVHVAEVVHRVAALATVIRRVNEGRQTRRVGEEARALFASDLGHTRPHLENAKNVAARRLFSLVSHRDEYNAPPR